MTGCPCGKKAWTTKAAADDVVLKAKIRAGLHGSTRRREQRSYLCPSHPHTWHVTSQPDLTDPANVVLPDYPPTDDEAAHDYITDALRHHLDPVWTALYADVRAEQTVRVLTRLQQHLVAQEVERDTRVEAMRSRHRAGQVVAVDIDTAVAEREEWRGRVAHFRAAVNARLHDARQAVKALNIARSSDKNARENHLHRDTIRRLSIAVTRHLHATTEPSAADRELWGWLTVLTVPYGDGVLPLADMVAGEHWTDSPDQLRNASSAQLGVAVDVAEIMRVASDPTAKEFTANREAG